MKARLGLYLLSCGSLFASQPARADVITEWDVRAVDITFAARLPPPTATRLMAIVQSAVYEAVNAITRRYPSSGVDLDAAPGTLVDAAVAAANRAGSRGSSRRSGPPSWRLRDRAREHPRRPGKGWGDRGRRKGRGRHPRPARRRRGRRPRKLSAAYHPRRLLPTALPGGPAVAPARPWLMASPDQFRPGPPPALGGERWTRDYLEVKTLGAKNSTRRTAEQADIARFWEGSGPVMYFPIARLVADGPGREVTRNARLLAAAARAMDDAAIAVFDAKYHYGFWRPITAIRNGDTDGNDATERDASWVPFIDTPMHPEYPARALRHGRGPGCRAAGGHRTPGRRRCSPPTVRRPRGRCDPGPESRTSCGRWRSPASTAASTSALPRKSVRPWERRSANSPPRRGCVSSLSRR